MPEKQLFFPLKIIIYKICSIIKNSKKYIYLILVIFTLYYNQSWKGTEYNITVENPQIYNTKTYKFFVRTN